MRKKELKEKIGSLAENIIASDLNLTKKQGGYNCPVTNHSKDNHKCLWYADGLNFYCHDCEQMYDIINHADTKVDSYQYLCDLANVEYKPKKLTTIKPVCKETSEDGYMYLNNRGISRDTIDLYRVRADNQWLYFNYATPDKQLVKTKWRNITEKKFNASEGGCEILYGMHLLKNQNSIIICEGEIDALSMCEIVKMAEREDRVLCSSLPNGSGSLSDKCIENSKQWLDRFDKIIICPDNDDAGEKFITDAQQKLSDYDLYIIQLPAKDANEFLMSPEYNPANITDYIKPLIPDLKVSKQVTDISKRIIRNGNPSGFVTIDYNMNGLQDGWVTLATGITGHGKTTFTRQILMTYAMRGIKSFMFIGESSIEAESTLLARLCAESGEIEKTEGTGGRDIYLVNDSAYNRYKEKYGQFIYMADQLSHTGEDIYSHIKHDMKAMVKQGVKLCILDNLMKFCTNVSDRDLLSRQKDIINDLKVFALKHNIHIILIAHLRKDGEKIAGAQEVENTADAVLRYERVFDGKSKTVESLNVPKEVKERSSAYILTKKVREEGAYKIALMEWDARRGALYNISSLPKAIEYERKGYWTRGINRYDDNDLPEEYRNNKALNANQEEK